MVLLLLLTVNLVVGCVVMSIIDKHNKMYNWLDACPSLLLGDLGWQFILTAQLWPIMYLLRKNL